MTLAVHSRMEAFMKKVLLLCTFTFMAFYLGQAMAATTSGSGCANAQRDRHADTKIAKAPPDKNLGTSGTRKSQ